MEYKISNGIWSQVIAVPSVIVDDYIKLASGANLKVLLYMLRNGSADINQICTDLNLTDETVEDSFAFWAQLGVLSTPDKTESSTTAIKPKKSQKPKTIENKSDAVPIKSATDYSPTHLMPTEIDAIIKKNNELAFLSQQVQVSFARTLTYSEQNLLIWMHQTLGFKAEIILTLCEYCANCGKANARYIESVANSWFSAEIDTLEKANNEVNRLNAKKSYINSICSMLRLASYPSSNQLKIIENWQTLGIADELIILAYDRTIDSIGSLKFPYMNKILLNWHTNGLNSVADVESFESGSKKVSAAAKQTDHSYDLDKFETLAVGASNQIGKD